jgi:hypothetical protein
LQGLQIAPEKVIGLLDDIEFGLGLPCGNKRFYLREGSNVVPAANHHLCKPWDVPYVGKVDEGHGRGHQSDGMGMVRMVLGPAGQDPGTIGIAGQIDGLKPFLMRMLSQDCLFQIIPHLVTLQAGKIFSFGDLMKMLQAIFVQAADGLLNHLETIMD